MCINKFKYQIKSKKQLSAIILYCSTVIVLIMGIIIMYYLYGYTLAFSSSDNLEKYITVHSLKFILGRLFLGFIIILLSLAIYYCLTSILLWIVNIKTKSIDQRLNDMNMWIIVYVLFIELIVFIAYSFYNFL